MAKIWLDGRVKVDLDESVPQIGAPEAWAAGYDGNGVKVAVLDTGIDATHPDLATQIDGTASFVPGEGITDVNGHGTHVASTIVGTGAASGGDYKGVAPGADLIVGKVLGGAEGSGQDSWVIAGMEWAAESGADVVNMSLGDSDAVRRQRPDVAGRRRALRAVRHAVRHRRRQRRARRAISLPGAAASALTVGAVDKQDELAYFSSTGPLTYSGAHQAGHRGARRGHHRGPLAGHDRRRRRACTARSAAPRWPPRTSPARRRSWPSSTRTGPAQQLKEQLMSSAKGLADGYSPFEVGTGRVDVAAAVARHRARHRLAVLRQLTPGRTAERRRR